MALKKYYLTTSADVTNTLKSSAQGLLFNYSFINLGTSDANLKLYLEDSNNNQIVIFYNTISAGEKIFLEEKFSLEGEDVKIYSDKDDVQVLIQILSD